MPMNLHGLQAVFREEPRNASVLFGQLSSSLRLKVFELITLTFEFVIRKEEMVPTLFINPNSLGFVLGPENQPVHLYTMIPLASQGQVGPVSQ